MTPPPYTAAPPAPGTAVPVGGGGGRSSLPESVPPRAPERAHGVELLGSLVGSGYRRAPGLVRRGDGQTVQLTPLLYALLESVDGHRRDDALAAELGRRVELGVSAADVEHLLAKLTPMGLLRTTDGSVQEVRKADPLLGLKLKVVITDPAVTRRVTAPFAALFSPLVVWPVLALFLVTCWWTFLEVGLSGATSSAVYAPGMLLTIFGLTVLSAGFHEFGHAAACRYGGATPGAMGAGLYVLWPAFYTDVDDSYRLSRWGRLRVDLGGLYFNAIVAVVFAGLSLATGLEALLLVVAAQLLQMVRQLAPFIRADGYHILADLTGVPDLFAHIGPTLKGVLPPNWRQPSPLQRWARVVVTGWVLVMVPLLIGLLVYLVLLLPRLAATAWDAIGIQGALLAGDITAGDPIMIAVRVLALISVTLPVAAISYLLVRIVRRTAERVLRATRERPAARWGAMLAAAFLAAVVAGAWWPSGQYVPVDGRGAGAPPAAVAAAGPVDAAPFGLAQDDEPGAAVTSRTVSAAPAARRTASSSAALRSTAARSTATTSRSTPRPAARPAEPGGPPAVAGPPRTRDWPFPFAPPAAPRAHDNQALAVGLTDGAVVHDVQTSWEWVTDGGPVDHENTAWALASCDGCATVSVAFQIVLVVGQSDVYTPVNGAVGLNYECARCQTRAIAVQLVATLTELPGVDTQARLDAIWAQVQGLQERAPGMTVEQTYALLKQVEAEFLAELELSGVLATSLSDDVTATGTPSEPAALATEDAEPVDPSTESTPTEPARDDPSPDEPAPDEPAPDEPAPGEPGQDQPVEDEPAPDGTAAIRPDEVDIAGQANSVPADDEVRADAESDPATEPTDPAEEPVDEPAQDALEARHEDVGRQPVAAE